MRRSIPCEGQFTAVQPNTQLVLLEDALRGNSTLIKVFTSPRIQSCRTSQFEQSQRIVVSASQAGADMQCNQPFTSWALRANLTAQGRKGLFFKTRLEFPSPHFRELILFIFRYSLRLYMGCSKLCVPKQPPRQSSFPISISMGYTTSIGPNASHGHCRAFPVDFPRVYGVGAREILLTSSSTQLTNLPITKPHHLGNEQAQEIRPGLRL